MYWRIVLAIACPILSDATCPKTNIIQILGAVEFESAREANKTERERKRERERARPPHRQDKNQQMLMFCQCSSFGFGLQHLSFLVGGHGVGLYFGVLVYMGFLRRCKIAVGVYGICSKHRAL